MNLHLHGHLSACVRDFGPVYSFWLFSYERMNGILGSYNTNNHFISAQLMQRFMDYGTYAIHNWPREFQEDYSSLIRGCTYNKGSLAQDTFESHTTLTNIQSIPPIVQKVLSRDDIRSLSSWSAFNNCDILTLYRQSKSVRISSAVIGSRYKSSVVCASKESGDVWLAEVLYFGQVFVKCAAGETKQQWVVAVKWYEEHPCKVWFGYPAQVWSTYQRPGYSLIPLCAIVSRAVYAKMEVDFGRFIGKQCVIVAVPLEHTQLAVNSGTTITT